MAAILSSAHVIFWISLFSTAVRQNEAGTSRLYLRF